MTTIQPQAPLPPSGPAPGSQVTVTVQNPPPALTQLPSGVMIEAEVVTNLAKGTFKLNSVFGKLSIKTSLPLPENSKLDLQVLRSVPQMQLMIKALNNTPLQLPGSAENAAEAIKNHVLKAPAPPTVNQTPTPATTPAITPAATPINLDIGALIKATVLRPINTLAQAPQNPPQPVLKNPQAPNPESSLKSAAANTIGKALKSAQNLIGKTPEQSPAVKSTEIQKNLLGKEAPAPTEKPSATTAKILANMKAGTQMGLRFVGAVQSGAQASQTTNQAPNVIAGTVIASTPSGQPIVNTPIGMLAVDSRVPCSRDRILDLK